MHYSTFTLNSQKFAFKCGDLLLTKFKVKKNKIIYISMEIQCHKFNV